MSPTPAPPPRFGEGAGGRGEGPLSSLRILDFSTLLPGPFASMFLADLGADVVRVEAPQRPDPVRMLPPFDGENSAWHSLLNRSKRSIALDLKKPGAADVVKRLVQTYDIVLEQFRPGVMDRLGIGYEALREANPRLIYCALTGYGQSGPFRERAGHDINYLALAGVAGVTGRREGGPLPLGVQVADVGGGSFLALVGILAAEIHRHQTGEGQFVDVSMLDGAIAWNAGAVAEYLVGGRNPGPETMRLNGGIYYDHYRTRDGRYLSVGGLEPKFWVGFCHAIGRPDLITPGLTLPPGEQEHLKADIREVIAARTFDEWMGVFAQVDACVEPVLSVLEMLEHPQVQARGVLIDVPTPDGGTQRQVGHPIKFSRCRPTYRHTGAKPGEHTEQVLREAGYTADDIELMAKREIFGGD